MKHISGLLSILLASILSIQANAAVQKNRSAMTRRPAPFTRRGMIRNGDLWDSESDSHASMDEEPAPMIKRPANNMHNDNGAFLQELQTFRQEMYPEAHMYRDNPLSRVELDGNVIRTKALEAKWLPIQVSPRI